MHAELREAMGPDRRQQLERALRAVLLRAEAAPRRRPPLTLSWRRVETGGPPRLIAVWEPAAPSARPTTSRAS